MVIHTSTIHAILLRAPCAERFDRALAKSANQPLLFNWNTL
jgi:hypothetical protein